MKKNLLFLTLLLPFLYVQTAEAQDIVYGIQTKLQERYPNENFTATKLIYVCGEVQTLEVYNTESDAWVLEARYPISTAKKGFGEQPGSDKTPRGLHFIKKKIGDGEDLGRIFRGRKPNEIGKIYTDSTNLKEDWVTTRIIWLTGLENDNQTSFARYIYIHGTQEEGLIGSPQSHGCIRMKNEDVIELFDLVYVGALVYIEEFCVGG
jgi:lipoprotein-anchoring transpeptidase ErfK/SrfK